MDWEKQDNELRNLMEGSGFLPDAETWDGNLMWRKVQQKRQSVKRRHLPVFFRIAAAACAAGLIGIGLWTLKNRPLINNDHTDSLKGIAANSADIKVGRKSSPQKNIDGDLPKHLNTLMVVSRPESTLKSSEDKESKNLRVLVNEMVIQKNQSFDEVKTENPVNAIEKNETLIVGNIEPAITNVSPKIEPQQTGTPPAKGVKLRVVHYNMLNGNPGTPPPVFVKTRKAEYEWDGLARQGSEAINNPSPQLKIDISPTPKKSL